MARLLRGAAWVFVAVAIIDPDVSVRRPGPIAIDVRDGDGRLVPIGFVPDALRTVLASAGTVTVNASASPLATVLLGGPSRDVLLPASGTVSVLRSGGPGRVRITGVDTPRRARVGWRVTTSVSIERADADIGATVVSLERDGLSLDRVEHIWSGDERRATVTLTDVPLSAAASTLTVRASSGAGVEDRRDVQVRAAATPLRVLALDARPSWASTFVRRAIEQDPAFAVAGLARASPGIDVRMGEPPARLSAETLAPFDVVILGALEAADRNDCAALEQYMVARGGTVVLVPDRRPTGACAALAAADGFEEVLLERPVAVAASEGTPGSLRASELALPRREPRGARVLARAQVGAKPRAVVLAVAHGVGEMIVAGALDAWRYRADDEDGFAAFWRATLAAAGERAVDPIEITAEPSVAASGRPTRLHVRLRPTELSADDGATRVPSTTAALVDGQGGRLPLRLWPGAEPGSFTATFVAPTAGRYAVEVATPDRRAAAVLVVTDGPAEEPFSDQVAGLVAQSTGGVIAAEEALSPLVAHVGTLEAPSASVRVHPARSAWWMGTVVLLLCGEWMLRRRQGER